MRLVRWLHAATAAVDVSVGRAPRPSPNLRGEAVGQGLGDAQTPSCAGTPELQESNSMVGLGANFFGSIALTSLRSNP